VGDVADPVPIASISRSLVQRKTTTIANESTFRHSIETTPMHIRHEDSPGARPFLPPSFLSLRINNGKANYTNIMLVHVGKTGGETVKSVLATVCHTMRNAQRHTDCLSRLPHSQLSNVVQSYLHCFTVKPQRCIAKILATTDAFLYTIRHPIDRILSWYRYVHPDHCQVGAPSPSCQAARQWVQHLNRFVRQLLSCFVTVTDWAYSVRGVVYTNGTATSDACRTLARQVQRGQNVSHDGLGTYLVANYEHYINRTIRDRPNTSVMVVRTEHLWSDVSALDQFLNGTGDFGALQGSAYTGSSAGQIHPAVLRRSASRQCKHCVACCNPNSTGTAPWLKLPSL
jgi:Sulfotransferase family